MENIETGLLLMTVGMTTVFVILLIVINLGKGLILLVNKYAPEDTVVKKQAIPQPQATSKTINTPDAGINNSATAAIVSAISVVTGGKGKVVKIEKV